MHFSGPVTRVTTKPGDSVTQLEFTDWRGWLSYVTVARSREYKKAPASLVARQLIEDVLAIPSVSQRLTVDAVHSFSTTVGTEEQPAKYEPHDGTTIADHLQQLLGLCKGRIRLDGTLTSDWNAQCRLSILDDTHIAHSPARFVFGENILSSDLLIDKRPQDYATSVLTIGEGTGDLRRYAVASKAIGLHSVSLDRMSTPGSSQSELQARARQILQREPTLPVTSLVVPADSSLAPTGSFGVGQSVTISVGKHDVIVQVIEATNNLGDSTLSLTVKPL